MEAQNTLAHAAYKVMMAAEEAFTKALETAFGARAVDYRYELSKRKSWPPEVQEAYTQVQQSSTRYFSLCSATVS